MRILPLNTLIMRALSGATEVSDLQSEVCRARIQISRSLRVLTDRKHVFYGDIFWTVSSAEWLERAEAQLAKAVARLDELGAPHTNSRTEATMKDCGVVYLEHAA